MTLTKCLPEVTPGLAPRPPHYGFFLWRRTERLTLCLNRLQDQQCLFEKVRGLFRTYCGSRTERAVLSLILSLSAPDVFSMCAGKTNTAAL